MARSEGARPGSGRAPPRAGTNLTSCSIYVLRARSTRSRSCSSRRSSCSGSSRATFDPTATRRAVARRGGRACRAPRGASASTVRSSRSTATGCRRRPGRLRRELAEPAVRERRRQPAFWNTMQLIVWGIADLDDHRVVVGVYSAVRQYSVADYVFTGLSFIGPRHAPVLVRAHRHRLLDEAGRLVQRRRPPLLRSVCTRPASPASTSTTSATSCCRC